MRRPAIVLAACALVGACLLAGCSSEDHRPSSSVSARPTPIDQLNTGAMRLARVRFCPLVPGAAVRDALGGRSTSHRSWKNGDKVEVEDQLTDVVHEFGCRWGRQSADGGSTSASVWVFARPVTLAQARTVVRDSAQRQGCRAQRGPGFGRPSQRQACRLAGGGHRMRVSGLVGDTWIGCEVAGSAALADLRRRTDAWCVQVASSLNTTR